MRFSTACFAIFLSFSANAGQWNYRCDYIDGKASCDQISEVAAEAIPDEFTKKYPSSQYVINFTVASSYFSGEGMFMYTVIASLHKVSGEKKSLLTFPSVASHSSKGYDGRNPTYALQREHLTLAAKDATRALVSDLMDR